MNEAVQTNVSPAGIWVIVVVAVACLAFWLSAIAFASRKPGVNHPHLPGPRGPTGPVIGGTHISDCGRSVAPSRHLSGTLTEADAETEASAPERTVPTAEVPATEVPTGMAAPTGTAVPTAEVPTQRTGAAGRPATVPAQGTAREPAQGPAREPAHGPAGAPPKTATEVSRGG